MFSFNVCFYSFFFLMVVKFVYETTAPLKGQFLVDANSPF